MTRPIALAAGALLVLACVAAPTPASPAPTTPPRPSPVGPTDSAGAGSPSPASPGASPTFGAWQRLADAPLPLTEVAAAAHDGRLWVAGGLGPSGGSATAVQVYEPAADSWSGGPALPVGLDHAALVSTGTALYVVGGYTRAGGTRIGAAVHQLNPAGQAWVAGPPLPEARAAGAAAWDGTRVVYGGGVGPAGVSGDVFVLEPDGWRLAARLGEPREHLAAASDGDGRVWFLGGRVGGLRGNLGAAELFESGGVRRIGDLPTPRGGVAAFWVAGVGACLAGGEGPDGTFDEVECIDDDGRLTVLPALGFPRHGLGAAVLRGVAYVALGGPTPGLSVGPVLEGLALP